MRAVMSSAAMRSTRRREDLWQFSPGGAAGGEYTLNECVAALKWTKQVQRAATVAQMGPDEHVTRCRTLHSRDTRLTLSGDLVSMLRAGVLANRGLFA